MMMLEPRECDQHLQQGHLNAVPVTDHKTKDDYLCSRNFLSSSQLSTEVSMSESSTPNFVYKRRMIQTNAATAVLPLSQSSMPTYVYKRRKVQTILPAQVSTNTRESDNCLSTNNSEAISVVGKEHMVSLVHVKNGMLISPDRLPVESNRLDLASKSGSVDGASVGEGPIIEEPKSKMQKCLDLRAVNDSCSSSKSNVDLGSASLKQMDDVGECSSSGALIMEGSGKDVSETNSCISFLRHHGVLEGLLPTKTSRSKKLTGVKQNTCCLRSCKVCGRSAKTLKMLICDLCEESFHMSCCVPPIKKVPVGAWFCHSCLRKKLKKMKETKPSKSPKDYSGPIASMIRDTNPYTSNVRIGKDFQVEVPDWSGPLTGELDDNGEPMEMTPVECASYRLQDWDSSKLSRLGSIGNWLQCREVVDGVNGTICGKWRRAPLFEVQTDDWECFGAVLWDPSHADCAVPQELDTDQVLKHLKYIEMWRPRLSANRWKLSANKGI